MSLYAMNNSSTNICENTILLDPDIQWKCPDGYYLVDVDGVTMSIGWYYSTSTKVWTAPPIITASFSPNPVYVDQQTVLSWSAVNATSVKIASQGDTVFPTSGSLNMTYSTTGLQKEILFATGPAGSSQASASVRTVAAGTSLEGVPSGVSSEPTVI